MTIFGYFLLTRGGQTVIIPIMQINVTKIKSTAETKEAVNLCEQVSAAGYDYDELVLTAPLAFRGMIERVAAYFRLEGELTAELELVCSRCLAPFKAAFRIPVAEVYTNKAEAMPAPDDDAAEEVGFFTGDEIDIAPALLKALFLELPMHPLCREDCRGICPECGADLNQGACSCRKDNIDFRLEKLKTLFAEMNDDKEV